MNKQEYLYELEKALRAAHVPDSADILGEYSEHFDMKLQDGYTEEEIAARLASAKEIAEQFASINSGGGGGTGKKIILTAGLVFADIFAGALFILLYAWFIALGVFTAVSAILGAATLIGASLWNIIPQMPYICSLLLGLTLLSLSVLSAIGTEYFRLYVTQLLRAYIRWHKGAARKSGRVLPPSAMHPMLGARKRRIMRSTALAAFAVFAVCFIAAFGSMMLASGSLEPWHVWHWFE